MAKTDIRLIFSCPRKYRVFKDRRVVTDRGEKYEGMPDRVLETQAPPKMKDDTHRIQHTACREKPESYDWKRGDDGTVDHHTRTGRAPAPNRSGGLEARGAHRHVP